MTTYTLRIARVVGSYDETSMIMICAIVTAHNGRFAEAGQPFEATARDAAHAVTSFMAFASPNGRELRAFFTTDAFAVFPAAFDLDFGYAGHALGTIANVDPATIAPLAAAYAGLGLPNADNAWLATLG